MTRFAGDGKVSRLRVTGRRSGRVVDLEARRVRSEADRRAEAALEMWLRNQPAGLHGMNVSDLTELLGYLRHLAEARVKDFFYEAQGHLHLAAKCADGDPARVRNLELFHQCITDVLAADVEAAGR